MRITEQFAADLVEAKQGITEADNSSAIKYMAIVENVVQQIASEVGLIKKDLQNGTINGEFVVQNLTPMGRNLTGYLQKLRDVAHRA